MRGIKIYTIGRVRERWLQLALDEYLKRLGSQLPVEVVVARSNHQLLLFASKERRCIALEVEGEMLTSEAFAGRLQEDLEEGGGHLAFLIGGPDGLPKHDYPAISLSKMTLPHQIARLMLLEQLYRACKIMQGSPYHRA
jgi:23S rRNA (pseudouridine1915-N3)-methyltransferase